MTKAEELLKRALPALCNWAFFANKNNLENADTVADDIKAYFEEHGINPNERDKDTIDMFGGE